MSLCNHLKNIALFHHLASERLFEAIDTIAEEDYRKDYKLFFESVHLTLNHLHLTDVLWHSRIKSQPPKISVQSLKDELYSDRGELKQALLSETLAFSETVAALTEDQLVTPVEVSTLTAGNFNIKPEFMVTTLVNHGTHHRGQITTVLTQLGIKYADLDMPFYKELSEWSGR